MRRIAQAVLALAPFVRAHSWIEEYQVISPNGSYVGNRGFARGYMARTDPGYNGFSDEWMLPSTEARNSDGTARTRINSTDLLCHPSQRSANYSSAYPMLQVTPGDFVAMKYLENGHVTLPWNITGKPAGSGTVYVFGTTQPDMAGEKIADVMQWTADGSGGDKRGFLLTAQNFDDGRCHQLNCGNISQQRQLLLPDHVAQQASSSVEQWCETDLQIPNNTAAGQLSVYWVWQWPTAPNADCNNPSGKDEYYTTCADFEVLAAGSGNQAKIAQAADTNTQLQENPQTNAVTNYASRTAILPSPSVVLMENNKMIGAIATANPSFASACSVSASVISQHGLSTWPVVYVPNTCPVASTFGSAAAASASADFASAAASYTAQRSSVWAAAFASAGVTMDASVPTATVSVAPSAASTPAPAPTSASSAAANTASVVTVTATVTITAGNAGSTSSLVPAASAPVAASAAADSITFSTLSIAGVTAPSSGPAAPFDVVVGAQGTVEETDAESTHSPVRRRGHARAFW